MRRLRELGKTVLLTTHYLDEAQALADRVAIVKDGRVLGPRDLVAHRAEPAHPRPTHPRRSIASPGANGSGETVERQTDDPTRLLNELTSEALARGERLQELSVGRPTLEDVYLELTADA